MSAFVVHPPSPTFERRELLLPRLHAAQVYGPSDDSDDADDEVGRQRLRVRRLASKPLRQSQSATSLRSSYKSAAGSAHDVHARPRRRTASHQHGTHSAPSTPPRAGERKKRYSHTAPSSPTRSGRSTNAPAIERRRSLDDDGRRDDDADASGGLSRSSSASSRRSSRSSAPSTAPSSLFGDVLATATERKPVLRLPDTGRAIARATEALQLGLIAFGAAMALWTLVAVLFASYGLTALDSFASSTRWLRGLARPFRRTPRPLDDAAAHAPPRPPMTSLVPMLCVTVLIGLGDQFVRATARLRASRTAEARKLDDAAP